MESRSNEIDLAAALRALRPSPSPAFAVELDARVTAGFPDNPDRRGSMIARFAERLRDVPSRRLLAPAGVCALAAIAVATAVVVVSEDETSAPTRTLVARPIPAAKPGVPAGAGHASAGTSDFFSGTAATLPRSSGGDSSGAQLSRVVPLSRLVPQSAETSSSGPFASRAQHRDIERSAQIVLGANASEVRDDAAKVFDTVHSYDGIVLSSSIRDGGEGDAAATFDLLIPSAKLGDALAAFSGIAEVRSRHESTADVTAPTIGLGERLRDSNAKVEGLLAQLASADTEAERASVEAELRDERHHVAALRARLTTLQRQVHLSRVSLRIESGPSASGGSSGGSWGVNDALGDAGHILAIAAGVTVIGLAIVGPLALICLLAWLAHRAWVRRGRERALD